MAAQLLAEHGVGLFLIKCAVLAEEDHVFGIDKIKAEILSKNDTVEILTAGGCVVTAGGMQHGIFNIFELARHVKIQP